MRRIFIVGVEPSSHFFVIFDYFYVQELIIIFHFFK